MIRLRVWIKFDLLLLFGLLISNITIKVGDGLSGKNDYNFLHIFRYS